MFPIAPEAHASDLPSLLLMLGIGMAFGFILESAGFGDSRKLAGQFYFRDLAVLRVMFTAIVTAALLLGLAGAAGWLVLETIWLPPTWLASALIGGGLMGVGFIVGGFCPGTSLVALATLKLDGLFFVLGALVGMFSFGESFRKLEALWTLGDYGRQDLTQLFDSSRPVVLLGVVFLALALFALAAVIQRQFHSRTFNRASKMRAVAHGAFVVFALALFLIEEPGPVYYWRKQPDTLHRALENGAFAVGPAEALRTMRDNRMDLQILDLRPESSFNLFHLRDARRMVPTGMQAYAEEARGQSGRVTLLVAEDEASARQAWKAFHRLGLGNLYYLADGLQPWLEACGGDAADYQVLEGAQDRADQGFQQALGSRRTISRPLPGTFDRLSWPDRIQLKKPKVVGGGCG